MRDAHRRSEERKVWIKRNLFSRGVKEAVEEVQTGPAERRIREGGSCTLTVAVGEQSGKKDGGVTHRQFSTQLTQATEIIFHCYN